MAVNNDYNTVMAGLMDYAKKKQAEQQQAAIAQAQNAQLQKAASMVQGQYGALPQEQAQAVQNFAQQSQAAQSQDGVNKAYTDMLQNLGSKVANMKPEEAAQLNAQSQQTAQGGAASTDYAAQAKAAGLPWSTQDADLAVQYQNALKRQNGTAGKLSEIRQQIESDPNFASQAQSAINNDTALNDLAKRLNDYHAKKNGLNQTPEQAAYTTQILRMQIAQNPSLYNNAESIMGGDDAVSGGKASKRSGRRKGHRRGRKASTANTEATEEIPTDGGENVDITAIGAEKSPEQTEHERTAAFITKMLDNGYTPQQAAGVAKSDRELRNPNISDFYANRLRNIAADAQSVNSKKKILNDKAVSGNSVSKNNVVSGNSVIEGKVEGQSLAPNPGESDADKLARFADPSVKLTKDEKKEAKELAKKVQKDYIDLAKKGDYRYINDDTDKAIYNNALAVENKTKPLAGFTMGLISKPTKFVENTLGKAIGKISPEAKKYNDEKMAAINQNIANGHTQNKLAYGAGRIVENGMEYATVNKALNGTKLAGTIGNALENSKVLKGAVDIANKVPVLKALAPTVESTAQHGANIALGTVADAALDTLPTEINNASNGMSGEDIAKDAAKNLAVNTAFNAGFEYLPVLGKKAINAVADKMNVSGVRGLLNAGDASQLATQPIKTSLGQTATNVSAEGDSALKGILDGIGDETHAATTGVNDIPILKAPTQEAPQAVPNIMDAVNEGVDNAIGKDAVEALENSTKSVERVPKEEGLDLAMELNQRYKDLKDKLPEDEYEQLGKKVEKQFDIMFANGDKHSQMLRSDIDRLDNILTAVQDRVDPQIKTRGGMFRRSEILNPFPDVAQNGLDYVAKKRVNPSPSNVDMDEAAFGEMYSRIGKLRSDIDDLGKKIDFSDKPKAAAKYEELKASYNFLDEAAASEDMAYINQAKKAVESARKNFCNAMSKTGDDSYKSISGMRYGKFIDSIDKIATDAKNRAKDVANDADIPVDENGFVKVTDADAPDWMKGEIDNNVATPANTSKVKPKTTEVLKQEQAHINKQISDAMHGRMASNTLIEMGNTPSKLVEYGAPNLPMKMSQDTINKIAYPKGYMEGKHNLGYEAFNQFAEQINNPVAIMKSNTQDKSFVILTELIDSNGNHVITPIHLDSKGTLEPYNKVASMYGRSGMQRFLEKARQDGQMIFEDKNRVKNLGKNGIKLSDIPASTDPMFDSAANGKFHFDGLQLPGVRATNDTMTNLSGEARNINATDKALLETSFDDLKVSSQTADVKPQEIPGVKAAEPQPTIADAPKLHNQIPLDLQRFAAKAEQYGRDIEAMADGADKDSLRKAYKEYQTAMQNAVDANDKKAAKDAFEQLEGSLNAIKERGYAKSMRTKTDLPDEVKQAFIDEPEVYKQLSNKDTLADAEKIFKSGSLEDAQTQYRDLLANKDPRAVPLSDMINRELIKQGKTDAAVQNIRELSEKMTKAGQFTQATVINLMHNEPMTALKYLEKELDAVNTAGKAKFKGKWKDFTLTDDEIKAFGDIEVGDSKAIKALYDKIGERIGKEYPTTFMEKLLEARRISMLLNARTNIRNMGANVPTMLMRGGADRVEAIGQHVAHIINPDFKVTQSLRGSLGRGRKLANEAYNSDAVQELLKGTPSKYGELKQGIAENKQIFKNNAISDTVDKGLKAVFGKGLTDANKALSGKEGITSFMETARNLTYKLLDLGDSPFVKENFVARLGSYINAQNIKSVDDIPDEAIQLAYEEAMKATYKDNSWAVKMVSNVKKGIGSVPYVGKPVSDAIIPFVQAPANIAARMVDYSPIRGSKGIADIIKGAKGADDAVVRKGIEELSKGLTGTAAVLAGIALHNAGIITGSYSDDPDKAQFEKQTGFKEYAIHVKDKYFTYDWMQPAAQSLIVGSIIADAIEKSDEYDSAMLRYFGLDDSDNKAVKGAKVAGGIAAKSTGAAINSWFNESPLQSLVSLMSGGYSGDKVDFAKNLWQTAVSDFTGSFIPAAVNATAKSADNVQRNTRDYSNDFATQVNAQRAKIPGLSKKLPIKYDSWGRPMKYGETNLEATKAKFIIPGDYSKDKSTDIDNKIKSLFDATNDKNVFPHELTKGDVKIGDRTLDNFETSEMQKDVGERSYKLAEAYINSDEYNNASDADRVATLKSLYDYSKAKGQSKFGKDLSSENKKYDEVYEAEGEKGLANYMSMKTAVKSIGLDMNDKTKALYNSGGIPSLKDYQSATEWGKAYSGKDDVNLGNVYAQAKQTIPSLDYNGFQQTIAVLDKDRNASISGGEIQSYLNSNNVADAQAFINAFYPSASKDKGTWKKVGGKWVHYTEKGRVSHFR